MEEHQIIIEFKDLKTISFPIIKIKDANNGFMLKTRGSYTKLSESIKKWDFENKFLNEEKYKNQIESKAAVISLQSSKIITEDISIQTKPPKTGTQDSNFKNLLSANAKVPPLKNSAKTSANESLLFSNKLIKTDRDDDNKSQTKPNNIDKKDFSPFGSILGQWKKADPEFIKNKPEITPTAETPPENKELQTVIEDKPPNVFLSAMNLWQQKENEGILKRSLAKESQKSSQKVIKPIDIPKTEKPNLTIENVFSIPIIKKKQILKVQKAFSLPITKCKQILEVQNVFSIPIEKQQQILKVENAFFLLLEKQVIEQSKHILETSPNEKDHKNNPQSVSIDNPSVEEYMLERKANILDDSPYVQKRRPITSPISLYKYYNTTKQSETKSKEKSNSPVKDTLENYIEPPINLFEMEPRSNELSKYDRFKLKNQTRLPERPPELIVNGTFSTNNYKINNEKIYFKDTIESPDVSKNFARFNGRPDPENRLSKDNYEFGYNYDKFNTDYYFRRDKEKRGRDFVRYERNKKSSDFRKSDYLNINQNGAFRPSTQTDLSKNELEKRFSNFQKHQEKSSPTRRKASTMLQLNSCEDFTIHTKSEIDNPNPLELHEVKTNLFDKRNSDITLSKFETKSITKSNVSNHITKSILSNPRTKSNISHTKTRSDDKSCHMGEQTVFNKKKFRSAVFQFVCNDRGNLLQWNVRSNTLFHDWGQVHDCSILLVEATNNLDYLFTVSIHGHLKAWSLANLDLAKDFGVITNGIINILIQTNDSKNAFICSKNGKLSHIYISTMSVVKTYENVHSSWIWSATFSPDDFYFFTSGDKGKIKQFYVSKLTMQKEWKNSNNCEIFSMAVTHDCKTLLTGDNFGHLKIWDIDKEELIYDHGNIGPNQNCSFVLPILLCPSKEYLFFAGILNDNTSFQNQWSYSNSVINKEAYKIDFGDIVKMNCSSDGEFLFTLDKQGVLRKYDIETKKMQEYWRFFQGNFYDIQAFCLM